ncbi:hypothetical protein AMEX_G16595, partial [Astyanax mexicanus]|uniref:Uncharacterized protein n=2 Tax=Astyanax mexicanus TaxID=7994 RepID=A0A3B1J0Z3_ASTMX
HHIYSKMYCLIFPSSNIVLQPASKLTEVCKSSSSNLNIFLLQAYKKPTFEVCPQHWSLMSTQHNFLENTGIFPTKSWVLTSTEFPFD